MDSFFGSRKYGDFKVLPGLAEFVPVAVGFHMVERDPYCAQLLPQKVNLFL
ncbi:hypothetical protein [Azotobacter chroococcum]|uniref:hypothetical protein n=1 Tax=Azotobacter chroococcum TaxID=353 RepID=UPI0013F144CB|nr:hypothetical protein [Azotobacter chroococcum]